MLEPGKVRGRVLPGGPAGHDSVNPSSRHEDCFRRGGEDTDGNIVQVHSRRYHAGTGRGGPEGRAVVYRQSSTIWAASCLSQVMILLLHTLVHVYIEQFMLCTCI